MNNNCPSYRIIYLQAAEIYYVSNITKQELEIKNSKESFDKHYSDLMPLNLDLLYLLECEHKVIEDESGNRSFKGKRIKGELYTDAFVNVSFKHSLWLNKNNERVFKNKEADKDKTVAPSVLRKLFYTEGFYLNGNHYVRYKRSAGAAKGGTCLFIKERLKSFMNEWSRAGLNEKKDNCLTNLTSYEAYKALSLSSLIKLLDLNPYNILFVKDFKHTLTDQEVIKVDYVKKEGMVASKEHCDIENNIFDGEGLLDQSVFEQCGYSDDHLKGMMLLRNRYFKCCAFNTNLQEWFRHNNITSIEQLNGYTFAEKVEDIVLVVSESCFKYIKLTKDGELNKENIKRWCDAVSDETKKSTFGIVKTDKETRFFNGDMVETTYQLLNTLQFTKENDLRPLISPYIKYINQIRDIKRTPEYARLYLQGEVKEELLEEEDEEFDDDSEDNAIQDVETDLNYSSYSFRNKVCFDLLSLNKKFKHTNIFKIFLFDNIIDGFRLKLYDGRILVDGTYATLFGNPLEYLQYIIKVGNHSLLEENKVKSSLEKDQIYCSFFGEEDLLGSRAPHMTMGNILFALNKKPKEIDTWFNLTRNIVVVDAINNNIQHRLNGADYDSDSMLLTNNKILTDTAVKNYGKYAVPYAAFEPKSKVKYNDAKSLMENLYELDNKIANNRVGMIVNLSQILNSHLWNSIDKYGRVKKGIDAEELYNKIAILAVLAGAEIDSAKKIFDFTTYGVYLNILKFAKEKGFNKRPVFFYYVSPEAVKKINKDGSEELVKEKISVDKIRRHVEESLVKKDKPFFRTTMDYLWQVTTTCIGEDKEYTRYVGTNDFFELINPRITTKGLSGSNMKQIEEAIANLKIIREQLFKKNRAKKHSKSFDVEKMEFNDKIDECYQLIKTGITNVKKARKMIGEIEKLPRKEHPYSLLFVLLYVISVKEKELGYSYKDLFTNDGGIPGLKAVNDENADFCLFDRYHYKRVNE